MTTSVTSSELAQALDDARAETVDRLAEILLAGERVLGVHGPPLVGKSVLLSRALDATGWPVIRLDLDGAYDASVVTWQWARGLARVLVADNAFAHLVTLDPGLHNSAARAARHRIYETLGPALADLALRDDPDPDTEITPSDLVDRTARLLRDPDMLPDGGRLVIAVDHLEAPLLVPRHPVDVNELLWTVRALMQANNVTVVIAARTAAIDAAAAPDAAFAGDGTWVELNHPPLLLWSAVARRAGIDDLAFLAEAVDLTGGNIRAMQRLLEVEGSASAMQRLDHAADGSDLLAARCLEHARTIHRYGAQLLQAIAKSLPPRSARAGSLSAREVDRAMPKLALAGLVYRAGREWVLADPIVAHVLAAKDPMTRMKTPLSTLDMTVVVQRSGGATVTTDAGGSVGPAARERS